jgi:NAD(P)-dependent dehydrogenase (short-subunit alcohol dehydrogenase family)
VNHAPAHDRSLVGRVSLVTDAGSGIGRASALALTELGASVVVVDRASGPAADAVREIPAAGVEDSS